MLDFSIYQHLSDNWNRIVTVTSATATNPLVLTVGLNHGILNSDVISLTGSSNSNYNFSNKIVTAVTSTTVTIGSINSSAFGAFSGTANIKQPYCKIIYPNTSETSFYDGYDKNSFIQPYIYETNNFNLTLNVSPSEPIEHIGLLYIPIYIKQNVGLKIVKEHYDRIVTIFDRQTITLGSDTVNFEEVVRTRSGKDIKNYYENVQVPFYYFKQS